MLLEDYHSTLLSWMDFLSNWLLIVCLLLGNSKWDRSGFDRTGSWTGSNRSSILKKVFAWAIGMFIILGIRGWLYWAFSIQNSWTPWMNFGVVVALVNSAQLDSMVAYSYWSFGLCLFIALCWLIGASIVFKFSDYGKQILRDTGGLVGLVFKLPLIVRIIVPPIVAGGSWYFIRKELEIKDWLDPIKEYNQWVWEAVLIGLISIIHMLVGCFIVIFLYTLRKTLGRFNNELLDLLAQAGEPSEKLWKWMPQIFEWLDVRPWIWLGVNGIGLLLCWKGIVYVARSIVNH